METKTGLEISLKGLDVIEACKKNNYDDRTTKERVEFEERQWVALDDLNAVGLLNWLVTKKEKG